MKVRWSQKCAGGCGVWLLVGQHAVRAHRGFWCPSCWASHVPSCSLVHPVRSKPNTDDGQLALPV